MIALTIIVSVLVLSIALFLIIKKISNVQDIPEHSYEEESSIIDFESISQDISHNNDSPIEDEYSIPQKTSFSFEKLKIHKTILMSNIALYIQKILARVKTLYTQYQQTQQEKRKQQEQAIQDAIKADQIALEQEEKMLISEGKDTSVFEVESPVENNTTDHKNETKANSFVNQLLSEDTTQEDIITSTDITDTYYYTYMEKRYISRIVASPRDVEAYKKLGELYVEMKNYPDALESFKCVMKLKPTDTLAARRIKDLSTRLGV
jgi:tetratricopeptide (TPR) repeat protein